MILYDAFKRVQFGDIRDLFSFFPSSGNVMHLLGLVIRKATPELSSFPNSSSGDVEDWRAR